MNPAESQTESDPTETYFDPEIPDMSEQQFSASLESDAVKPDFVPDEEGWQQATQTAARESHPEPPAQAAPDIAEDSPAPEPAASVSEEEVPTPDDDWRNLVSAKVNSYKSRRPRKERYPSLQLQFVPNATDAPPRPAAIREPEIVVDVSRSETQPEPAIEPRIFLEATARVLEFPRPATFEDELAEPVLDRPRILEAPELLPPPPAMGGITIEPRMEPEPERRPGFDMPLQSAPMARRLWAGIVDATLVGSATALFEYIFARITGSPPPGRLAIELSAGLFIGLWWAYQYSLLVFSGTTPGLWVAGLRLSRFDGCSVPRALRRWRVLASGLSAVSLGLGYAWSFLDEDQLSWHDRITKTHLALREKQPR